MAYRGGWFTPLYEHRFRLTAWSQERLAEMVAEVESKMPEKRGSHRGYSYSAVPLNTLTFSFQRAEDAVTFSKSWKGVAAH